MIRSIRLVLASVVLALVPACVGGTASTDPAPSGTSGEAGGDTTSSASASAPRTPAPSEVVGTWTAGRGGTTVAYDTITGTSSSNASGLAFQFAEDGTFAKAYRDSSGGDCGIIVVGTESGGVEWGDGTFQLHSTHGVTRTWTACGGSVANQPMAEGDLDRGQYTWQLDGGELVLTSATAGSARFRKSP